MRLVRPLRHSRLIIDDLAEPSIAWTNGTGGLFTRVAGAAAIDRSRAKYGRRSFIMGWGIAILAAAVLLLVAGWSAA